MNASTPETSIDRSGWPSGPWDGEPDRVEWTTKAGLPAIVLRQSRGHLCGYVAVPPGHALHQKHYNVAPGEVHDAAHGGLTYAAECSGPVCHVPAPGEPDNVWWFGFDAAHGGDRRPSEDGLLTRHFFGDGPDDLGTYRTVEYMRASCERLAVALTSAVSS